MEQQSLLLEETARLNLGAEDARQHSCYAERLPPPAPEIDISCFSNRVVLYRGSISTVERAKQIATGKEVILKCYHKAKMHEKHYHKLDREIRCMAALSGPYVASLYTWFSDDSCVWLVLEYCEGGDLFRVMADHGGRLDEHYVCVEIIAPLLRVLEKCSHLQLLHRDIKPENIFLSKMYKLKLGDWGLATCCAEELPFSRSGTLDYMSPDVLRNPVTQLQEGPDVDLQALRKRNIKPYTDKVDVWAAGILAYELVAGKPPFEVESESQTAALIMHSNDIAFPAHGSVLWADFVRCALIKDPVARPSAAELMSHAWIVQHLHLALATAAQQGRKTSKASLLEPLPLPHPSQLLPPGQVSPPRPSPATSTSSLSRSTTAHTPLHKPGHVRVASAPPAAVVSAPPPPCTTIVSHPIHKTASPAAHHQAVFAECSRVAQQQQQATPAPTTPDRDARFSPLHQAAPHVVCATPTRTAPGHKHSNSWSPATSASYTTEQEQQQQQQKLAWGAAPAQSPKAAAPHVADASASSSPLPVCTPEPQAGRPPLRADSTPPCLPVSGPASKNNMRSTAAVPPRAPKACTALDFEQHAAHTSARTASLPASHAQQQLHCPTHDGGAPAAPVAGNAHHLSAGGFVPAAAHAPTSEQLKYGPELVRNTSSGSSSSVGACSSGARSSMSLTRALPSFSSSGTRSGTVTRADSATVPHHSKGSGSWGSMAVEAAASTADALAAYMAGLKADADQAILHHYPVLCAPRNKEVDAMLAQYTTRP